MANENTNKPQQVQIKESFNRATNLQPGMAQDSFNGAVNLQKSFNGASSLQPQQTATQSSSNTQTTSTTSTQAAAIPQNSDKK